jgi:hypothetical protein
MLTPDRHGRAMYSRYTPNSELHALLLRSLTVAARQGIPHSTLPIPH